MHYLLHVLVYVILIYSSVASAADNFYLNKLNFCKVTKAISNDYEPANFPTSNDLRKVRYSKTNINGSKIIIKGRVLDANCVPVSDAKIYLWQVGPDGKYHYKPFKDRGNKQLYKDDIAESNFIGAGSAITNNQGEFYFVTVKPAAINKKAPQVNIRATHPLLSELQTVLYLTDSNILQPPIEMRKDFIPIASDTEIYDFEIVMQGETLNKY